MNEKNADRRVRKTKNLLKKGLIDLMKERSFREITVKELADYADINRGTFYLHYKDVFDLMEQTEHELMEQIISIFRKYNPHELSQSPRPIYADLFSAVQENAGLCRVLLGPNGDIAFLTKFKTTIYEECLSHWSELNAGKSDIRQEYFASFILSGYIGLIQLWLESGMAVSTDELADMGEGFILTGIRSILPVS